MRSDSFGFKLYVMCGLMSMTMNMLIQRLKRVKRMLFIMGKYDVQIVRVFPCLSYKKHLNNG